MTEVFSLVCELGIKSGIESINKLPGCWETEIGPDGERWRIALNGHKEEVRDSQGGTVPPFHIALTYNGWPAGIVGAHNGIMAAGGIANEARLVEILKDAIAAEGPGARSRTRGGRDGEG